jgi:hypothetical protein
LKIFKKKKISELIQHDISKLQYKSKNNFFSIFKDILEMTSIKGILRTTLSKKNNEIDLDLFFLILDLINEEVRKNQSELIFIYVPSWSRYYTKFNEDKILFTKKKEILNYISNKNIKFVDFDKKLEISKDKKKYFPLRYIGHFNSEGYKLIAKSIEDLIN